MKPYPDPQRANSSILLAQNFFHPPKLIYPADCFMQERRYIMPEILTFKSTISKEGLELTGLVSDAILQVEELLRKIEEVKEFTYKGYDIHEFNSNCDMLLIKFSIQWRG